MGFKFAAILLPFWGFFGHRLINEMAIYTLPPPLIAFYKENLDYIRQHAVDPDKRRYAVAGEAEKHFLDLDHWGSFPFEALPRDHRNAYWKHVQILMTDEKSDTLTGWLDFPVGRLYRYREEGKEPQDTLYPGRDCLNLQFFAAGRAGFPEQSQAESCLDSFLLQYDSKVLYLLDTFSIHGILPYNLERCYRDLIRAFRDGDRQRILRLSADIGHYIGDAHVPLHTTENYNGQLTGQEGIHAFWESRLPELFAGKLFNFFTGKATTLAVHSRDYFWQIVFDSHTMVDSVLSFEAALSKNWPEDLQYCLEKRGNSSMLLPCESYARAYYEALDGQVGRRMRAAVKSIGDTWLSAWTEAGKPDLSILSRFGTPISRADSVYLLQAVSDYEHLSRKKAVEALPDNKNKQ